MKLKNKSVAILKFIQNILSVLLQHGLNKTICIGIVFCGRINKSFFKLLKKSFKMLKSKWGALNISLSINLSFEVKWL